MSVRAKFFCSQKGDFTNTPGTSDHNKHVNIVLNPVPGNSEENKQFFKYTPSGNITLSVVNPAAAEQFEVGKEYYVDFTPADQVPSVAANSDALKKMAEVTLKAVAEISCPDKKQEILEAMADVVKQ